MIMGDLHGHSNHYLNAIHTPETCPLFPSLSVVAAWKRSYASIEAIKKEAQVEPYKKLKKKHDGMGTDAYHDAGPTWCHEGKTMHELFNLVIQREKMNI